jgi:CBS domain-containing protein
MRIMAICSNCQRELLLSPQTAKVEQDARAVVQRMLVLGVRHLPVTSSDGQLIGMVSMRDLLAVEAWA